jgi:hypothetical protein
MPILAIFAVMRVRKLKILVSAIFMFIFFIKMTFALAPAILSLNNKLFSNIVLPLDQESKTDKDDPEKDAFKEKKVFDEYILHNLAYQSYLHETKVFYNAEHSLFKQVFYPVVPTPPPNV